MIKEQDLKCLNVMSVGSIEILEEILYLYDRKAKGAKSAALVEIFNYGYMMGKRDERAKKKKALN